MIASPPVMKAAVTTATSAQDEGLPCGLPPSGTCRSSSRSEGQCPCPPASPAEPPTSPSRLSSRRRVTLRGSSPCDAARIIRLHGIVDLPRPLSCCRAPGIGVTGCPERRNEQHREAYDRDNHRQDMIPVVVPRSSSCDVPTSGGGDMVVTSWRLALPLAVGRSASGSVSLARGWTPAWLSLGDCVLSRSPPRPVRSPEPAVPSTGVSASFCERVSLPGLTPPERGSQQPQVPELAGQRHGLRAALRRLVVRRLVHRQLRRADQPADPHRRGHSGGGAVQPFGEPPAALAEVAALPPEWPQRGGQAECCRPVILFPRPAERGPQVVVLGAAPGLSQSWGEGHGKRNDYRLMGED